MKYNSRKVVGTLMFISCVQYLLALIIAESLYPGYSVSENTISDPGVGSTSLIYNSSAFLLGVIAVVGTYFVHHAFGSRFFSILIFLMGVGAIDVRLFPKTFGIIHTVSAMITFLFAGLSAIMSF